MDDKKSKILTNSLVLTLLAITCCALWGSAFPSVKTGYRLFVIVADDYKSQILFAGIRFFFAGCLTIIFGSIANKSILKPHKKSWGRIIKLCLFQTVLQYLFFYIGLAHTSGVKASIITGSNVFFSILIASLFFRQEALSLKKVVGCVLGFTGVVLVNLNGASLTMSISLLGEGFMLIATIACALAAVLIKHYSSLEKPIILCGYQFLCGGFILMVLGFVSGGRIVHITWQAIAILLYLAFLSATAYTLWSILLKYNSVSKVTVWGFAIPVFGVFLSMVFLNEAHNTFNLQIGVALVFVCLGIYIVNRAKPVIQVKTNEVNDDTIR